MTKRLLLLSALVAIWLPGCAESKKHCTLGCGSFESYQTVPINKEVNKIITDSKTDLTRPPNYGERVTEADKDVRTNPK